MAIKTFLVTCIAVMDWPLYACKPDEKGEQEWLETMGRHVGFRKNEIVFNLRAACPSLKSFDAHQLADFINDNEQFDKKSLGVELDKAGSIVMHAAGDDGEQWRLQYTKKDETDSDQFANLFKVLKEEIKEQKETHFPIRRVTQKAARTFFDDFPRLDGNKLTTKAFKERWFRLKPQDKGRFAKSIKDDFWGLFNGFYKHLRAQNIDVQGLIETGWLPLKLQEAFFVHFICQVAPTEKESHWKDKLYDGAGQILTQATLWTAGWMKQNFQHRSIYHTKYGDL